MSTRRVDSSTPASRITMPSWAARPVPTSRAVGVARPRAQGQAITSTATAAVKPPVGSPSSAHAANVSTATASTTGTKTAETRSASRCTGALVAWACRTRSAIRATAVSRPIRVTSTTSRPDVFSVAPTTSSPGALSTGTLSPVSIDSSTPERPSRTTPSVATCSPGRTRKRMPGRSRPTADEPLGAVVVEQGRLLGAELEQRAQRRPGPLLGAGLAPATEQQERRDGRGDLDVGVRAAGDAACDERPAVGDQGAQRHQGVHRARAVPGVHAPRPGGTASRPTARPGWPGARADPAQGGGVRDAGGHREHQHDDAQRRRDQQPTPVVRREPLLVA